MPIQLHLVLNRIEKMFNPFLRLKMNQREKEFLIVSVQWLKVVGIFHLVGLETPIN